MPCELYGAKCAIHIAKSSNGFMCKFQENVDCNDDNVAEYLWSEQVMWKRWYSAPTKPKIQTYFKPQIRLVFACDKYCMLSKPKTKITSNVLSN